MWVSVPVQVLLVMTIFLLSQELRRSARTWATGEAYAHHTVTDTRRPPVVAGYGGSVRGLVYTHADTTVFCVNRGGCDRGPMILGMVGARRQRAVLCAFVFENTS